MNTSQHRARCSSLPIAACLVAFLLAPLPVLAAPPGPTIVATLQERLGLSDAQVRGGLGALLVFCRERLSKPEFDDLARTIPQADHIMQQVKLQGVVNGPLDTIDDFVGTLSNLGIGKQLGSKFAPAVVKALGDMNYSRERDILARVID